MGVLQRKSQGCSNTRGTLLVASSYFCVELVLLDVQLARSAELSPVNMSVAMHALPENQHRAVAMLPSLLIHFALLFAAAR